MSSFPPLNFVLSLVAPPFSYWSPPSVPAPPSTAMDWLRRGSAASFGSPAIDSGRSAGDSPGSVRWSLVGGPTRDGCRDHQEHLIHIHSISIIMLGAVQRK
eukprot:808389-Pyramimonas_sp.AAC.1